MKSSRSLTIALFFALGSAHAATSGRVIVDQIAKPNMDQAAVRTELTLTQAMAFPRDWFDDQSRWSVLAVPADVDLSALRNSRDPEAWVSTYLRDESAIGLQFVIDTDGDAIEMNVYERGKLQLGASGTMGQVYAPRIEGNRLLGHYVNFGDLFGSALVIDLQFDAEIWQAAKSIPLPADGGPAGAAYLALVKAVHAGDRTAIEAAQPSNRPRIGDEEFKEALPMMQAMMPKKPKITGGKSFGDSVILSIVGDDNQPASAELRREGERWVMVRSSAGSTNNEQTPSPPAFAGTVADLCPMVIKNGIVCGDTSWNDEAFAMRDVLAIQSDDEVHMVLLAPSPLKPQHASALWESEQPLEDLFGKAPARGLLLMFEGASGELSATAGYHIDPEDGFNEEYLGGEAVRIGDKLYGSFTATKTDPDTGEAKVQKILRFEAAVLDKR